MSPEIDGEFAFNPTGVCQQVDRLVLRKRAASFAQRRGLKLSRV
jgi:hypothetical protein